LLLYSMKLVEYPWYLRFIQYLFKKIIFWAFLINYNLFMSGYYSRITIPEILFTRYYSLEYYSLGILFMIKIDFFRFKSFLIQYYSWILLHKTLSCWQFGHYWILDKLNYKSLKFILCFHLIEFLYHCHHPHTYIVMKVIFGRSA